MSKVIFEVDLVDPQFEVVGHAQIIQETEYNFVLTWNDFVVNEWTETFNDLWSAMARLSVLHFAVNTESTFHNDPRKFASNFEKFLDGEVE